MVPLLKNLILFLASYDTPAGALPHPRRLRPQRQTFHAFERRYTFPLRAISTLQRCAHDGLGVALLQRPGQLGSYASPSLFCSNF